MWLAQRAVEPQPTDNGRAPRETDGDRRALAGWVEEAQTALGGRVFRIPNAALDRVGHRIATLDRRAQRLGAAPIRLTDTGQRDADGHAFVVLQGNAPVLAGWALAAIVNHREAPPSVRAVSELGERLDAPAFAIPRCEHCGVHRHRNTTFVVAHVKSGEMRQVGSNCLRDFLGGNDPERACRQAEYLALARNELKGSEQATNPAEHRLEPFAASAAHVVRAHGFTSREQERRTGRPASADRALRSLRDIAESPDRADQALAEGALQWARALPVLKPELSRFEAEALAVIRSASVSTRRDRGLICALIATYRQRRARSRHLAQPGARLETVVLVERVTPLPSRRHGVVHRCELIDAEVNRLAWWQTRGRPLQAGEVVRLTGRVERHTRFGLGAVTVLSHCGPEFVPRRGGLSSFGPVLDG